VERALSLLDMAGQITTRSGSDVVCWSELVCRCMGYAVAVQTHQFLQSHELRLVCNGYYPEIHVIHPRRLEVLFSLSAQIQPDWVTALCVLRPVNREGTVPASNYFVYSSLQ